MTVDMISGVRAERNKGGSWIPPDIVIEILSWLPATSLVRFRRVCKSWRSITYDPNFIDIHLDRARKARPPSVLLFFAFYKWDRIGVTVLDDSWAPKRLLSRPSPELGYFFLHGSSCNGLICIVGGGDAIIEVLNPATGESLTAPKATKSTGLLGAMFSLGFHPVTKEYKIIRFFNLNSSTICEAYTLGTSSWRRICTVKFYPVEYGITTAKGQMYWLVHTSVGHRVASVDLKDERVTLISYPIFAEIYPERKYMIGRDMFELQGSICIPVYPVVGPAESFERMDMWVLNDQICTKPEWTRKYSLILPWGCYQRRPLLIHKERILVHTNEQPFAYDRPDSERRKSNKPVGLLSYYHRKTMSPSDGGGGGGVYDVDDDEEDVYTDYKHFFKPCVHVESLVALRNL